MKTYVKALGAAVSTVTLVLAPLFAHADVGFFSPQGVFPEFSERVDFAMINAYSPEQVLSSIEEAERAGIKLFIDLGPQFRNPAPIAEVGTSYQAADGTEQKKAFAPRADNKVWADSNEVTVLERVKPYINLIKGHEHTVDTLFLIDEPYLNGVSKAAYERLVRAVRKELTAQGIGEVKIGVIFAGAMFDKDFARLLDAQAVKYVEGIDNEYERIASRSATAADQQWIDIIGAKRLTTYDLAGNMYTDGGIPEGVDVVSFDYYVSTLLLDGIHQHSLAWFAERFPEAGCGGFAGQTMSEIRKALSFFQDGPVKPGEEWVEKDRALLDAMYQCRMKSTLAMLREHTQKTAADEEIMLIGESSNNGLLEFDASATPEQGQPEKLVELRVRDEVQRAKALLEEEEDIDRLMFFTYQDEYDQSIKLQIGGAAGMPSVLEEIYEN